MGGRAKKGSLLNCGANLDRSEKLTSLVVGNATSQYVLKMYGHCHTNNLTWITYELFKTVLKLPDAKMDAAKRSSLLFIDKCPAHPPDTAFLCNIKIVFSLQIALATCSC
jgi:hypothetical protein